MHESYNMEETTQKLISGLERHGETVIRMEGPTWLANHQGYQYLFVARSRAFDHADIDLAINEIIKGKDNNDAIIGMYSSVITDHYIENNWVGSRLVVRYGLGEIQDEV